MGDLRERPYGLCPPSQRISEQQANFPSESSSSSSRNQQQQERTAPGPSPSTPRSKGSSSKTKPNPPPVQFNPEAMPFVPLHWTDSRVGASNWTGQKGDSCSERGREQHSADGQDCSDEGLRTRLIEQIEKEKYECMICCDKVRIQHWIWSCSNCFSIFHLRCIQKWASKSQQEEVGWRCPGCQSETWTPPNEYRCFCGAERNPRPRRCEDIPHSCGGVCGGTRRSSGCPHRCNLLCHPGPCPPCPRMTKLRCLCAKEEKVIRCGSATSYQCEKFCEKTRNCEVHICGEQCHSGQCPPCAEIVVQTCFCGRNSRELVCSRPRLAAEQFECEALCGRRLECGNHDCNRRCHSGDCGLCPLAPDVLVRCPCSARLQSELLPAPRSSCTDPIAVCGQKCNRSLTCGPPGNEHVCEASCHEGPCPPCPKTSSRRCRCGANSISLPCAQLHLYNDSNPVLCEKRCKKKRSCKFHKCGAACCVEEEHLCMQVCGKRLACGLHDCDRLCHAGRCPPCLQASFEELHCECGFSVLEPPVPCGAKRPVCPSVCSRRHACDHPVRHLCHSDPDCPPCTHLTHKYCFGRHEIRTNIPCHLESVSCGKPCGVALTCGVHSCRKPCHADVCACPEQSCEQACPKPRSDCGHPCFLSCHGDSDCPPSVCKTLVAVECRCGNRTSRLPCNEIVRLWTQKITVQAMNDQTVLDSEPGKDANKCLPCNGDCAKMERNRRLAEALNISNPDLLAKPTDPIYTDFLKSQCAANPELILSVEKVFMDLVGQLNSGKHSTKSFGFQPMSRDHRRIIHEYADYFVIDTFSYDPEPQRNVLVTAKKGRSRAPSILLSASVVRETRTPVRILKPSSCLVGKSGDRSEWEKRSGFQSLSQWKDGDPVIRRAPSPHS